MDWQVKQRGTKSTNLAECISSFISVAKFLQMEEPIDELRKIRKQLKDTKERQKTAQDYAGELGLLFRCFFFCLFLLTSPFR